jgi:hypothetical protein
VSSPRRALGALLLLASCSREEPPPPEAPPWVLPALELGGCAAVTRGPTCELSEAEREVRFWVATRGLTATAQLGARSLPVVALASGEGTRLTLEVPAAALAELGAEAPLELTLVAARGSARHVVALRRHAEHPALARARTLRREGKLGEAKAALVELDAAEPVLAARAQSLSARLALAAGDIDGATRLFGAAMAQHHAAGRASDEALDAFALAFSRREKRDFAGARAALDGARDAVAAWDEGRAHAAYYLALVERDRGSSSGALTLLAEAEARASRLGLVSLLHDARDVRARLLQLLGRSAEADATLRQMNAERPAGLSPCRAGELANNLAWNQLLRAEASEPFDAAVLSSLDEAADVFRRLCPRPAHLQTVLVNRALAALFSGETQRALELSREARAAFSDPSAEVLFWLLDLEARTALAAGRGDDALARYEELLRRADAAALPEAAWRALVGIADARAARGEGSAAIQAYRDAEARLDGEGLRIPLEEGRAAFLAGRARGAEKLALALLARSDAAGALTSSAWGARASARGRCAFGSRGCPASRGAPALGRRRRPTSPRARRALRPRRGETGSSRGTSSTPPRAPVRPTAKPRPARSPRPSLCSTKEPLASRRRSPRGTRCSPSFALRLASSRSSSPSLRASCLRVCSRGRRASWPSACSLRSAPSSGALAGCVCSPMACPAARICTRCPFAAELCSPRSPSPTPSICRPRRRASRLRARR